MEMSNFGRRSGGVISGLKDRFGIGASRRADTDYQDEYDDYAGSYDEYDEGAEEEVEADRYDSVTMRTAGTNRRHHSSYASRASSDLNGRRSTSAHPPLVNYDDVRASTKATETFTTRRRSNSFRNSVGRASDFTPSGAEIDEAPTTAAPDTSTQSDAPSRTRSARSGGYNSLFDSSPTRAALQPDLKPPASAVGQGTHSAYDPYATYEGAGATSHQPTREVMVLTPVEYGEVESIARSLKAGDAVVLSLRHTPSQLSKRVLDFAFGVASALDARVDCIADKVFAITRPTPLTEDEIKKLRAKGVM